MPVFEVSHWNGGISPFSDRGITGSAKFLSNIDIRKSEDSLSCGQALIDEGLLGTSHSQSPSLSQSTSLSPSSSSSASTSPSGSPSRSQSPSASASRSASKSLSPSASSSPSSSVSPSLSPSAGINNVYVDLVYFWVKASDGSTYGFGNAGNIYRRYADGFTRNVYRDPDGGINGAVEKPSSDGRYWLQWTVGTAVKRKLLPGNGAWTDVETIANNLRGTDWHTSRMIGGSNYIANGPLVALVGYDDSYTNEALDIVPGNEVKTIIERNGRAVIGTYKTGYPNKGVNGAIDCEYPLVQVGTNGELFFSDFTTSMPIRRFPGGGRVNPGGVTNETDQIDIYDWEQTALSWVDKQTLGNLSLWGVFNADTDKNGVYSFGRKNKEQPFTLNLEYALEVDEIGAVANVDGTTIISYRDGSDFGVKAVDSTTKATGTYQSLELRAPTKRPAKITRWQYVEVELDPLPSGCSVALYYKMNKADSFTQARVADGSLAYSSTDGELAVFSIGSSGKIYEFQLILTPSGNNTPEVRKVTTFFE